MERNTWSMNQYCDIAERSKMTEEKRLNEIIRVKKCPNNFVTMDKTFLEDTRLSYKAKGILAYLLSKPNN